jgi:cobalt/nickel transport protein
MTRPSDSNHHSAPSNRTIVLAGLGLSLLVAVLLSPFASPAPDGLDRVSQDHQFDKKALEETPAQRLPFHALFDEYAARGAPETIATPIAGLVGTLITFGLAWGAGKLLLRSSRSPSEDN